MAATKLVGEHEGCGGPVWQWNGMDGMRWPVAMTRCARCGMHSHAVWTDERGFHHERQVPTVVEPRAFGPVEVAMRLQGCTVETVLGPDAEGYVRLRLHRRVATAAGTSYTDVTYVDVQAGPECSGPGTLVLRDQRLHLLGQLGGM